MFNRDTKEVNNKSELVLRGVKRITEYFPTDIEFGLFIINHLYGLIEIDKYNETGNDIKTKFLEKTEIKSILENEFLPN